MSLRIYKRIHLYRGITLNLAKGGPSISLGGPGAHITFGHHRITRTIGLPGSGIYWTSRTGSPRPVHHWVAWTMLSIALFLWLTHS